MDKMDKKSVLDVQFTHPNDPPPYTLQHVPAFPNQQQQYHTFTDIPQNKQPHSEPQAVLTATPAKEGCIKWHRKNMPQTNSVVAAVLIISSGGMNIASSNGYQEMYGWETELIVASSNGYQEMYGEDTKVFWFVAAIVGAQLGAVLTNKYPKKYFMLVSSLLVLLGGVIAISSPWGDNTSLLWARLFNGLAVGLVLVPTLVMSGEVSVKERRGMLAGTVDSLAFSIGFFLQILCSSLFTGDYNYLIIILIGIISLIYTVYMVIESPVYLLLHDQEQEAIDSLRRLQYPSVVTTETYALLEEHKHYIAENKELSKAKAFKICLPALIRLCIYRGIIGMSCSIHINKSLIYGANTLYYNDDWAHFFYGLMRLIGGLVGVFTIDSLGRKKMLVLSLLPSAALAIAVGVIFIEWDMTYGNLPVLILLSIFQLFSGFVATSLSAYLSESFPMECICIVFVFEMLMHIIMVLAFYHDANGVFCIVLGSFLFLFAIFVYNCLPETKNTTLREAQSKFKSFLSKGF